MRVALGSARVARTTAAPAGHPILVVVFCLVRFGDSERYPGGPRKRGPGNPSIFDASRPRSFRVLPGPDCVRSAGGAVFCKQKPPNACKTREEKVTCTNAASQTQRKQEEQGAIAPLGTLVRREDNLRCRRRLAQSNRLGCAQVAVPMDGLAQASDLEISDLARHLCRDRLITRGKT